ncbi:MAG TPA: ABC transporter permease [Kribbellaceae bacterium]|nr:ABC transporter permease [Kribbellaceae bacterium]
MVRYIVRRLLQTVVVLAVISLVTFLIFWAGPARPAREICNYHCTEATFAEIDRTYGFDKPVLVQYGTYMSGLINPDGRDLGSEGSKVHCPWPCFDRSIHTGLQVWDSITDAFWPTFWLAVGGAVLWLAGGVLLGIHAALRKGRRADKVSVAAALVGASMPALVLGNLLLFVFVVKLGVLPFPSTENAALFTVGPGAWLKFYILPWITLALVNAALYARLTRANMLDAMNEDFIRTARAKGLRERRIVYKHGMRVALAPLVTAFGLDLGTLLGGAVVTEQIFSIYGIGRLTIDAVLGTDLPIIMAVTMLGATAVVVANLVVDIVYAAIDPRVRTT